MRSLILTLPFLDVPAFKLRGFRVALDCVNGAGGVIMPQLLEALGCEVVGIHVEPHGRFPRDPEPTAENLAELGEAVRSAGADLGFVVTHHLSRVVLVITGAPVVAQPSLML